VEGPAVFIIPIIEFEWKRRPPLCHPDRSVAKWRDLQFSRPFLEMFFDGAHRRDLS
jgi:hypothetical protein